MNVMNVEDIINRLYKNVKKSTKTEASKWLIGDKELKAVKTQGGTSHRREENYLKQLIQIYNVRELSVMQMMEIDVIFVIIYWQIGRMQVVKRKVKSIHM